MNDIPSDAGLWALFVSAFVSATVLPGNSEVVLAMFLARFPRLFADAVVVATVGNTLGAMTSYAIGRLVPRKPVPAGQSGAGPDDRGGGRAQRRAVSWLRRHGEWALLLSWVPVIGDALCVSAGWLRMRWWLALTMIAIGKCARYLVIAAGVAAVVR